MLRVENLNITLESEQKTLNLIQNVSFNLQEGNIYSIIGQNGSGKSTLLKALTNLLNQKEFKITGKVFWNSSDLLNIDCKKLLQIRQSEIKYLFQDAIGCFDPIKKIEYYFTNYAQHEVEIFFKQLYLENYNRIKTLYPNQLSNGMAQRISLSLAFLAEPKLLILDEPTSALDYPSQKAIFDNIKKFVEEKNGIVLLVTQELSFAEKISDKIAFLHDKELSQFYNAEEIWNIKDDEYIDRIIKAYKRLK